MLQVKKIAKQVIYRCMYQKLSLPLLLSCSLPIAAAQYSAGTPASVATPGATVITTDIPALQSTAASPRYIPRFRRTAVTPPVLPADLDCPAQATTSLAEPTKLSQLSATSKTEKLTIMTRALAVSNADSVLSDSALLGSSDPAEIITVPTDPAESKNSMTPFSPDAQSVSAKAALFSPALLTSPTDGLSKSPAPWRPRRTVTAQAMPTDDCGGVAESKASDLSPTASASMLIKPFAQVSRLATVTLSPKTLTPADNARTSSQRTALAGKTTELRLYSAPELDFAAITAEFADHQAHLLSLASREISTDTTIRTQPEKISAETRQAIAIELRALGNTVRHAYETETEQRARRAENARLAAIRDRKADRQLSALYQRAKVANVEQTHLATLKAHLNLD